MDEEFDPNAYGAEDTPAPVANLFDPAAYASGEEKKVEQPKSLPTFTPSLTTFYYPSTPEDTRARGLSYSMEGGTQGGGRFGDIDLRNHTLEQFLAGKSPFVAVARKGAPTGEEFQMNIGSTPIVGKWVDTGGGLREGQTDIATSNPDLAKTGIQHGFDPASYADNKPQPIVQAGVPDIHAFMEPAPTDTPEADTAEEPSTGEQVGKAIGKGISKFGEALSNRPIPQFKEQTYQPPAIPQVPAQQTQVIPGQGMIGAAIPQPLPTPGVATPTNNLVGGLMDTVHGALLPFGTTEDPRAQYPEPGMEHALSRMFPEQEQAIRQNVAEIQADPTSRAAYKAYGQLAMTVGPFAARGLVEAAPVAQTVGRSLTGANMLPRAQESGAIGATGGGKRTYQTPSGEVTIQGGEVAVPASWQPKGLPVKAASVQGLKNPPRAQQIQQMNQQVAALKAQGNHAQAKVIQGQINQAQGLSVGPNAGQPPVPPQAPPPQNPPPGGGIPPRPPKSVPEVLRNRQIKDRVAAGKDSVFTRADYDARQKANGVRQDFGAQVTRSPNLKENVEANKDMEAATFIAEAQGNKVALQHDLEMVRNSKNAKLAKKYEPILKYAMDNFTRISDQLAKSRYMKLMSDQLAEDQASGITYPEREGYVTHVLKSEPENAFVSFFTGKAGGGGLSRYFTKSREFNTLAEAINAGVDPASVNIADLAQHRIASSRRLILNKALFNELKNIHDQAGNPVLKGVFRHPDPPHSPVVPKGYELMNLNGVEVAVHPAYSGLFKSLYGDSALRRTATGRTVMRAAGIAKSYTLAADTYHGFRGIKKGLFYGGKGSRLGFKRGTTVYELSDEGLDTAVKNNEITQKQADWAKSARPAIEEMMKNGLNVSKYADNLVGQMHVNFPGTGRLNDLIFNRVFRGAMIQASHANYLRNLSRFPELTKQQVARRTAKEMNEVFGNMMSQGILKDKTLQDSANLILLSPQWVESQVRAEFRGYGQMGNVIADASKGKFRVGTVAQGQATAVLAYLVGNQIINYATTGHSTFENDGWLNKMSAFLPVGDRGVYLNPFALSAEYADRFLTIMDRQGEDSTVASVLSEMATSKLTGAAHSVVTLATQRDWRGRKLEGSDVYLEAGKNLVPVPIGVGNVGGSLITLNPNSSMGFDFEPQYDKITQSVLQAMGERGVLGDGAPVGPVNTERGVY
jgi:hypothetical protein